MVDDGGEVVVDEDSPPIELDPTDVVESALDPMDVVEVSLDVVEAPGINALLVDHEDELLMLELVDLVVGTAQLRLIEVGSELPFS